jgi:hypothetical protein
LRREKMSDITKRYGDFCVNRTAKMTVCRVLHFVSKEMGLNIFLLISNRLSISPVWLWGCDGGTAWTGFLSRISFESASEICRWKRASWKSSKGKRAVSEISLLKGVKSLSLSLSLKLQTRERERIKTSPSSQVVDRSSCFRIQQTAEREREREPFSLFFFFFCFSITSYIAAAAATG